MNPRVVLRLVVPLVAVGVLLLVVGSIAAWFFYSLQRKTSDLLEEHIDRHQAVEKFDLAVRDIRFALCEFLFKSETRYLHEAVRLHVQGQQWLDQMDGLVHQSSLREEVNVLQARYKQFGVKLNHLANEANVAPRKVAKQTRVFVRRDLHEELRSLGDALLDDVEEKVQRVSAQNRKVADRMVVVLLLLGSCGALAGLLAGVGFSRGLRRSVTQLSIPVHDAAGKLNEVVGPVTIQSATRIEDLETGLHILSQSISTVVERLQQSQREVLRAEQLAAIGQLAAGLAHELRNPLMAIQVLVQAARLPEESRRLTDEDLAMLEGEINRMDHLLQTFLDFARPPQPSVQITTVQAILDPQLRLIESRANLQKIEVVCNWPTTPVRIAVDVGMIQQMFLNLFLNALDAMPKGGTLSVEIETRASADAVVRVEDTGAGLPADLDQRIFEPFVSTKETGTGMGLAICRRIAESHGGTITAENGSTCGAVFSVRLPLPVSTIPNAPN